MEKLETNWQIFEASDNDWTSAVKNADGYNYLLSNEWSNHLKNSGWECLRFISKNKHKVSFIQGFVKNFPFRIGILWFPDWVVGNHTKLIDPVNDIKKLLGFKVIYIRFRSHKTHSKEQFRQLNNSFSRAKRDLDTGLTMHLSLLNSLPEMQNHLSKNWKRNLKRSNRVKYKIIKITDPNIVNQLYQELTRIKKIKKPFKKDEIFSLMESWKDKLTILGAVTDDGKIHALRGAIIENNIAVDIFAAANNFARKNYLSYRVCWELVCTCKRKGAEYFDFNGVDRQNMGVYNFKKGTGAKLIKTLGEFEYSDSKLLRKLVNFVIGRSK